MLLAWSLSNMGNIEIIFCEKFCERWELNPGQLGEKGERYLCALPTPQETLNFVVRLDRETEELRHERVSLDLGKLIMKGRNDKVNH